MDKQEAVKQINNVFNNLQIPYALIGSFAVAIWGMPRATKDIDFIADIPSQKIKKIMQKFQSGCFRAELQAGDAKDPLSGLLKLIYCDNNQQEAIDIILGIKKLPKEIYKRTITLFFLESNIPVISPEDLIIAKLLAGSPLDINDAKSILSVMKEKLDMDYLNNICKKTKINLPL